MKENADYQGNSISRSNSPLQENLPEYFTPTRNGTGNIQIFKGIKKANNH